MNGTTLNKVYLLGCAGRDGELRTTMSGVALGVVSIATNRSTRQNGEYVEVADWHHIKAFGTLGEKLAAVRKGERVFLEAELQYSRWTDKNGIVHYRNDLIAKNVVCVRDGEAFAPEYVPSDEEPPLPEKP